MWGMAATTKKEKTANKPVTIRGTVYFPPPIYKGMTDLLRSRRISREAVKPGVRVTLNLLMIEACRKLIADAAK